MQYIYIHNATTYHFILYPWVNTAMNNCLKCRALVLSLLILNLFQVSVASVVSTGDFNKDFFVMWAPDHVNTSSNGRERSLKLDQVSGMVATRDNFLFFHFFSFRFSYTCTLVVIDAGSGFASTQMFLFGQIDMKIKLVPGNSAGTVLAYYVSNFPFIPVFLIHCVIR